MMRVFLLLKMHFRKFLRYIVFCIPLLMIQCAKNSTPAPVVYKGSPLQTSVYETPIGGEKIVSVPRVEKVTVVDSVQESSATSTEIDISEQLLQDQFLEYRVKKGDTIASIATNYHLTEPIIINLNRLEAPYILQPNQKLRLPIEKMQKKPALMTAISTARLQKSRLEPLPAVAVKTAVLLPNEKNYLELKSKNTATPSKIIQKTTDHLKIPLKIASLKEDTPESATQITVKKEDTSQSSALIKPEVVLEKSDSISLDISKESIPKESIPQENTKDVPSGSTLDKTNSIAVPKTQTTSKRFRIPIVGKLLTGFGIQANGTQNDGINIAAPKGAILQAAADGTVAYCGSELKGFGNLILINHPEGWMSAYAHLDYIKVQRGQSVKAGQAIGTVGTTGDAQEPQVHFELRHNGISVDPNLHL